MSGSQQKRCLNCGTPLADGGKYCHQCGQAAHTQRLTAKNFVAEAFMRLTRLNKGVAFTCCNLLARPWHVISDYIRGRRVCYADPVQLLLVLAFLNVALSGIINMSSPADSAPDEFRIFETATFAGNIANAIIRLCLTSTVIQYLVIFLPAVPMLMLVNRRKGEARYNLAEYLLAAIYMSDAVLLFQLLVSPFDRFLPAATVFLTYFYILATGACGVYKSLGHLRLTVPGRILRVAVFLVSTLFCYLIVLILAGAVAFLVIQSLAQA